MTDFDVVIYDTCGGPFSAELERERLLGGSELLLVQIAEALKARGHRVLCVCNGSLYAHGVSCHALLVSRFSPIPKDIIAERIVGVATDCSGDHLKEHLVVASSDWQADQLRMSDFRNVTRIYNMLGPIPQVERQLGQFVFASGPTKGRAQTIDKWCEMRRRGLIPDGARLELLSPGWGKDPGITPAERELGVGYSVPKNSEDYRRLVASAEGLFFVSAGIPETYGNVAALAYRAGVKTHILCLSGFGGLKEATPSRLITDNENAFENGVQGLFGELAIPPPDAPDHSPEALVGTWEEALGLTREVVRVSAVNVVSERLETTVDVGSWSDIFGFSPDPEPPSIAIPVAEDFVPSVTPFMRLGEKIVRGTPFYRPSDLAPLQEVFDGEYDLGGLEGLKAPRVLDIGSNVGAFTRWIQARCPGARVTAYEPDPGHVKLFRRNNPDAEIIEAAVTSQEAPRLHLGVSNSGMNSLYFTPGASYEEAAPCAAVHPKDLPPCDLLKIDTEGSEVEILAGYRHLADVSVVVYEYHRAEYPAKIAPLLEAAGLWMAENITHDWSGGRSGIQKWVRSDKFSYAPLWAGKHLGHYVNTLLPAHAHNGPWGSAQRYFVHDRVLVGGSILDGEDAESLRESGVTHVLSAEFERDDTGKWPEDKRARHAWNDDGGSIPEETIRGCVRFIKAVLSEPGTMLYAHCQMGGSRGPMLGYLALRSFFGFPPEEAMYAIRAPWMGDNKQRNLAWYPHQRYIDSIELVLSCTR